MGAVFVAEGPCHEGEERACPSLPGAVRVSQERLRVVTNTQGDSNMRTPAGTGAMPTPALAPALTVTALGPAPVKPTLKQTLYPSVNSADPKMAQQKPQP